MNDFDKRRIDNICRQVLGEMLGSPAICSYWVGTGGRALGRALFRDLRHMLVFEAIVDVHGAGDEVNVLSVAQKLKANRGLGLVGGPAYLMALCQDGDEMLSRRDDA